MSLNETNVPPAMLLNHHLKQLRLPTLVREHENIALECAHGEADYQRYLLRLCELEHIDRERRNIERRIRQAKFPQVNGLDAFDFKAIPSLSKPRVLELARCGWIEQRESVIALGNAGTGKTHTALAL